MDRILQVLERLQPLLELIIAVLWGVYIYFTIRTFREIKRQTDLQSEAFLVAAVETSDRSDEDWQDTGPQTLHSKWNEIITTGIPDAISPEKTIRLRLTNRGRSDIADWKIQVMVTVSPGEFLEKNYNTVGEIGTWTVRHLGHRHHIAPDDSIVVPIALTGSFPKAGFSWKIDYTDMRKVKYSRFGGDTSYEDINALAFHLPAVNKKRDD